MRSWSRLSIRQQLVAMITFLVLIIQVSTFSLISWFDNKERQTIAIEQAGTITKAFSLDFERIFLKPSPRNISDIRHRISEFQSIDRLILINTLGNKSFNYSKHEYTEESSIEMFGDSPVFHEGHWHVKTPIEIDGFLYGHALVLVDPELYKTQAEGRLTILMTMFPLEVLLAILLAWRLSARYTEPFAQLAQAMQKNDVKHNVFTPVTTRAHNEVKQLFEGYNGMIAQIQSTTAEMRHQSMHDPLTGLLNRYGFDNALQKVLHNDNHAQSTLLKIDLDQFRLINDMAGFAAGDALLKLIAHHLFQNLPAQSIIARLDADVFFALLPNNALNNDEETAENLLHTLKDFRLIWESSPLSTSASCGLVSFYPYEYTVTELIKAADNAHTVAKSKGHNKLHVYHADDKHSKRLNLNTFMVAQIKEALGRGPAYFELYAQAIVPLQESSEMVSYEILLRLHDHDGKLVNPDDFLPTAEHYNLMADIDCYVLQTYLEMTLKHPEHINNLRSVHINLAGSSLNHIDFQNTLKNAVKTYDFPWEKLEMEVTETSAVGNLNKAADFINFFRGHGIGFALDDFGTGMSSFDYLKKLPFDIIKIDGSFVRDMHTDPVDRTVIRYIQEICDLKNQKTVAEYIETAEDVAALKEIGVTYGQGYYLGKPKPLSEWITPKK